MKRRTPSCGREQTQREKVRIKSRSDKTSGHPQPRRTKPTTDAQHAPLPMNSPHVHSPRRHYNGAEANTTPALGRHRPPLSSRTAHTAATRRSGERCFPRSRASKANHQNKKNTRKSKRPTSTPLQHTSASVGKPSTEAPAFNQQAVRGAHNPPSGAPHRRHPITDAHRMHLHQPCVLWAAMRYPRQHPARGIARQTTSLLPTGMLIPTAAAAHGAS